MGKKHGRMAIIVAAGMGSRLGGSRDRPKQFWDLGGCPLLAFAGQAFQKNSSTEAIVLVGPAGHREFLENLVATRGWTKVERVVDGGVTRQESVGNGLRAVKDGMAPDGIVAIHDAARPFVPQRTIDAGYRLAEGTGACVAAVPAVDTTIVSRDNRWINAVLERSRIFQVQTPQVFRFSSIYAAHEKYWAMAEAERPPFTDDASLVRWAGWPVAVFGGDPLNFKITTPTDLELARALLRSGSIGENGK